MSALLFFALKRFLFSCRIGFPGWKIAARLGLPLFVKAQALRDEKAKVFVPVSEDFLPAFACVAEAETLCSLHDELQFVFADGFETIFGKEAKFPAVTASLVLSSRDGNR